MINPIITSCGSFLIFWYIIYFLRDDGFWGKISDKPSWGDNQVLLIFIISFFLFFSLIYFLGVLKNETKNKDLLYFFLYIFVIASSSFVYSISYSEKEAAMGSVCILLALMIVMSFLKTRSQRLLVSSLSILALSVYLTIWTDKISFKQT